MMMKSIVGATALIGLTAGLSLPVMAQELPKTQFTVIGSADNTNMHKNVEAPFWNEYIPKESNGAITVDFKGLLTSGLKGPEIVRLLSVGAVSIANGTFTSVAADDETFNGIDMPGISPDLATARKVADAYKPVIDEVFTNKHGIKLLAILPFTSQVFFCATPINSLADLKGKKVRVYGRGLADLVESQGATAVTLPFGEVVPALQTGVVDCAITGVTGGNTAKWFEVAKYLYNMPVGWSLNFYAASLETWNAMDPAVRGFLEKSVAKFEDDVWTATAEENQYGINCNTGVDPCQIGTKADMKLVEPTAEDKATLAKAMQDVVIANWAERCGADCAAKWNDTVGEVVGMSVAKK